MHPLELLLVPIICAIGAYAEWHHDKQEAKRLEELKKGKK